MSEIPAQKDSLGGEPDFFHTGEKFQDIKDEVVGAPGTPERRQYDLATDREIISLKIREFRKLHNLTQSELGERVGVQKNQISKLERNPINVTIETLVKIFSAMNIKVNLSFEEKSPPLSKAKKVILFACLFVLTHVGIKQTPAPQSRGFLCLA